MTDKKQTGPAGFKVDENTIREFFPTISRRRLIKAGAAAPLVATLMSRPAWGTACSFSGDIMSGNASHHDHDCSLGAGCTPGFWKNNFDAWDKFIPGKPWTPPFGSIAVDPSEGTQFSAVFGMSPCSGHERSLAQVLEDTGHLSSVCSTTATKCWGGPGNIDPQVVAAVLNSFVVGGYGPSPEQIIEKYREIRHRNDDSEMRQFAAIITYMNERGCPLSANGACNETIDKLVVGDGKCLLNVPVTIANGECTPVFSPEDVANAVTCPP